MLESHKLALYVNAKLNQTLSLTEEITYSC